MVHLSGKTKEDAIRIDDDDDPVYRPVSRLPGDRRKPRSVIRTAAPIDLTIDSDDGQDVVEAEPMAWSTAYSRKTSGDLGSHAGQAGPSTPRREGNSQREVVSLVAPPRLDLPDPQDQNDEDEGIAPAWEGEEQGNLDENKRGAAQMASSPYTRFLAGLPERAKVSQSPKVDTSPSKPAPAVATRPSPSILQQSQTKSSLTAIRPGQQTRARSSPSISTPVANSSLNEPLASTVTSEGEFLTVLPSNQQPADTHSPHAAPTSGSPQDELKNVLAGVQEDYTQSEHGGGSETPIGEVAGLGREQTTSGRVNNAPTTGGSVGKPDTTRPMPTNAHVPHNPTVAAVQRKQRAVKSVRRVTEARVLSSTARFPPDQQSQASAKEGSMVRGARQTTTAKESSNGVQSGDRSLGTNTKSTFTDQPRIRGVAAQRLFEPAQASSSSGDGRTKRESASSLRHEIAQSTNGQPEDYQNHIAQGYCQARPESAISIDVDDLNTALLAVETCLKAQLTDRHESHTNLTGSQMWRQRTCYEREFRAQHHMRMGPRPPALPENNMQTTSSFAYMSPMQVPFNKTTSGGPHMDISQEIINPKKPKDFTKSTWVARPIKYKSGAIRIPPFREYVFLRDSILADNATKLLYTPYVHDESAGHTELAIELPQHYEMKHDMNASFDVRSEQCRFYKGVVDAFLRMIGVSWDSVLFWLLAPEHEIKRIYSASSGWPSFEKFLLNRSNYHLENFMRDDENQTAILFDRNSEKWKSFWAKLELPTTEQCRLAAMACAVVLKECGFSIWYLAQQTETLQKHISEKLIAPVVSSTLTFRDIVCRVCHQHNCLSHGELRQVPEDSWEDEPRGEPAHFDDDPDIEKVINYKVPANPDAFNMYPESEMIDCRGSNPPPGKFDRKWWERHGYNKWEDRKSFFPCSHEGSCEKADCRCYRENITCEKTCKCSRDCQRRFPGCECASKSKGRLCGMRTNCLCAAFNRECDADLCGKCGAADILDPVNRFNEDMLKGRCTNVAIQRGVPRKTFLGQSEVHGFGLYIGEDIKMDDYIGEYTGETISFSEGERRSTIYNYQKTMYLFKLDEKKDVDPTYMGNKLRFINNAKKNLTNCMPRNLLCNTVFRLALYATKDLKASTELFFDYGYPEEIVKNFKQPTSIDKQKTKNIKKSKGKTKSSKSSIHNKPSASSSRARSSNRPLRTLTGLANASSGRAEKQKAKSAAQSIQESTSSKSQGPQKARKTATDQSSGQRRPLRTLPLTAKRLGIGMARHLDNPKKSFTSDSSTDYEESQETQDLQSTQEVQETDDDEDDQETDSDSDNDQETDDDEDDSASESGRSAADGEDAAVEDSDNVSMRSTRSRARRSVPMAQVVAAKQIVGKGPARKRKRVIVNSDDE